MHASDDLSSIRLRSVPPAGDCLRREQLYVCPQNKEKLDTKKGVAGREKREAERSTNNNIYSGDSQPG